MGWGDLGNGCGSSESPDSPEGSELEEASSSSLVGDDMETTTHPPSYMSHQDMSPPPSWPLGL